MDISLVAAKLLGMYLVLSGLFLIFRGKTVPHLLKDFFGHPAIVYLTGVILILLSSVFIMQHNVWDGTWRTVVTFFAWVVLLKGIAYLFVPEKLHKMVTKKTLDILNLYGLAALVAGVALYLID